MIRSESPASERGGLGLGGRSGSDREPSQSLFIPTLAGSASPPLAASGLGSERENPTPSQRRRSDRMPTAAGDAGERNRTIHHSATRYAREPGTGSIALASTGLVPSFLLAAKARSRRLPVLLSLTTPIPPSRQQAYRRTASLSLLLYYLNNGNTHAQVWLGPALASTNHLTYLI